VMRQKVETRGSRTEEEEMGESVTARAANVTRTNGHMLGSPSRTLAQFGQGCTIKVALSAGMKIHLQSLGCRLE